MQTTYRKIIEFNNAGAQYLQTKGEEDTKFSEALKSVIEELETVLDGYSKKLTKINRKHCLEDPKTTAILRDDKGQYQYNKDGEEKRDDELEELLDHVADFDIDTEFVEPPADLHKVYIKKFTGFVIK